MGGWVVVGGSVAERPLSYSTGTAHQSTLKFLRDDLMPAAARPSVNSATVSSPSPSTSYFR